MWFIKKVKRQVVVATSNTIANYSSGVPGRKVHAFGFHTLICEKRPEFKEHVMIHLLALDRTSKFKHICECYTRKGRSK